MASCQDLSRLSPTTNHRSLMKATPVPIFTSKRLIEPLNRLKTGAQLFRRRNYSSQLDISSPCSFLAAEHTPPSLPPTDENKSPTHHVVLKRSNSMVCPQRHLQSFLKKNHHRNSICVQLTGCPIDESSTDDYRLNPTSSTRYPKMSHINEQEPFPSDESLHEKTTDQGSLVPNNTSTLSTPPITKNNLPQEQQVPSAVVLRSRDVDPIHRLSHPVHQRQSTCSSFDEPFYDCKQQALPETFDFSLPKISTCTMTGKSLNNLDECLSMTSSSEDKCVQTTFDDFIGTNSCVKQGHSSTSLSSTSSTSIQTDSLENNQKIPILTKTNEISKDFSKPSHFQSYEKQSNIQQRLLAEQTCIYWVNYLGSTAIKISRDNTPVVPAHAITRLKQSTQYARVLPIIGLSISSRGVEFLKHAKDRLVICFHDIKTIHCACQDQDLRYFAYVTREQRLINGTSPNTPSLDRKQQLSPSLSINRGEYHDYCHVFVVKNESMSTEILLTFGQAFDIAYQNHRQLSSRQIYSGCVSPNLGINRIPSKPKRVMSSSMHSPGPSSSSSSSSADDRRIFV